MSSPREVTSKTVVHTTSRLQLRQFTLRDTRFILELLNEPAFLENIGDKGVRTEAEARRYLSSVPLASYAQNGFGLYAVELRNTDEPIGMCGLLKRDTLEHCDLGFAYLQRHWGHGYAVEAAAQVLSHAHASRGLSCVLAITTLANDASGRVLTRIGMQYAGRIRLANQHEDLKLYRSLRDSSGSHRHSLSPP